MPSKGRLKIICYQGATARKKFDIDEDDNEQLSKQSKNDEREFVDLKWLPSPHSCSHDDHLHASSYNENDVQHSK